MTQKIRRQKLILRGIRQAKALRCRGGRNKKTTGGVEGCEEKGGRTGKCKIPGLQLKKVKTYREKESNVVLPTKRGGDRVG